MQRDDIQNYMQKTCAIFLQPQMHQSFELKATLPNKHKEKERDHKAIHHIPHSGKHIMHLLCFQIWNGMGIMALVCENIYIALWIMQDSSEQMNPWSKS